MLSHSVLTVCNLTDCNPPEFSRQEYWGELPFPPPENLPDPGIEPVVLVSAGRSFITVPHGKPCSTKTSFQLPFSSRKSEDIYSNSVKFPSFFGKSIYLFTSSWPGSLLLHRRLPSCTSGGRSSHSEQVLVAVRRFLTLQSTGSQVHRLH